MLPSRLFRNTGVPPVLRSLLVPRTSLPASIAVQLHLRLGVLPNSFGRNNSTTSTANLANPASKNGGTAAAPVTATSQPLSKALEPKLSLTFTCTVSGCGERSTHEFTKRAYEHGIVLVQCPGCKNRHLIADHLGWFKESTEDGKLRTVEDILQARGETIRRGRLDVGGVVEYAE